MKRSRMFLGLTAGLLAVAGAVAVKASNFGATKAYYITSGGVGCTLGTSACLRNVSGTKICPTLNLLSTYYTLKTTGGRCNTTHPLKYNVD